MSKQYGITRRQTVQSLMSASAILPAALSQLSWEQAARAGTAAPLGPKGGLNGLHFPAKAKRVIYLYMHGGVSHLESFDPKPRLAKDHGKPYTPEGHGKRPGKLLAPQWPFKRYGKSGAEVSDLFPHIGSCVDDMCIIRSMRTDSMDHTQAAIGLHTGSFLIPRPSAGSWLAYGLGTENQNLPAFIVVTTPRPPWGGNHLWAADFLPGSYQGTRIMPGGETIPNIKPVVEEQDQVAELGLADAINRRHLKLREGDPGLVARIKSFETAFKMQRDAPEAFDVTKETDATLNLYGLERGRNEGFAWQCLLARRLSERGVRFVEVISHGSGTDGSNWDAHPDMATHVPHARMVDQPIAALLKDLKSRGMLEDTLVVWTTEFGRTAYGDGTQGKGRQHSPKAYSTWLAGAGIKAGQVYGSSDEYGMSVADKPVHVHDLNATMLHLLGIDHTKLTYRYAGRDFRLTDVHGEIVRDILT